MISIVSRLSLRSDLLAFRSRNHLDLLLRLAECRLHIRYSSSLRIVADITGITQLAQRVFYGGARQKRGDFQLHLLVRLTLVGM